MQIYGWSESTAFDLMSSADSKAKTAVNDTSPEKDTSSEKDVSQSHVLTDDALSLSGEMDGNSSSDSSSPGTYDLNDLLSPKASLQSEEESTQTNGDVSAGIHDGVVYKSSADAATVGADTLASDSLDSDPISAAYIHSLSAFLAAHADSQGSFRVLA